MYLEFYSLREQPFNVTPDPKFLYMTDQHATAMNHLLFGIRERKGFVLLSGRWERARRRCAEVCSLAWAQNIIRR